MPIRINLLAEAQSLEDVRRRDPVKRVILAGIILVALVVAWYVLLLGQTVVRKSELSSLESNLNSRTNEYRQIILNKIMLDDGKLRLDKLQLLSSSRFLVGNLLNELQKTTMDNIQLVRLKLTQSYIVTEEVKPKAEGGVVPKPATATEKINITLTAKDIGPNPGDSVNKFREALSSATYFHGMLGKMNEFRLVNPSPPQFDPDGKQFVLFTLQADFPDKKR